MTLTCHYSGSSGNLYTLTAANGETLLIEAGVPFKQVLKAVDFKISNVVGCLISHEHQDHAQSARDMELRGIRVYAPQEVIDTKGLTSAVAVEHKKAYNVGSFKVVVLDMAHDVRCVGYIILHPEMGKLLFATDTYIIPYRLRALNHILIEANYSDDCLAKAIERGLSPQGMKERLMTSHMELQTAIDWLKSTDLSEVREVVLIHISHNNGNGKTFAHKVVASIGKPTYVAVKGQKVNLDLQPF